MRSGSRRTALLAGVAFGILTIGIGEAVAGGFAIREESAYGQGSSYAGVAAGGSLSSMFWNPATMTQQPGINIEGDTAGIFPYAANKPGPGAVLTPFGLGGTGNTGNASLVPSGYASWQVTQRVWLGLALNAPFGTSVSFPDLWAGRNYAGNTSLKTYNTSPSVAWKINDWLSVGVGLQIQYADASFANGLTVAGLSPFGTTSMQLTGKGWGVGWTAGVTVTPTPAVTIGLGWRSMINQDISGTFTTPLPGGTPGPVSTTIKLPDTVSLGVRYTLNDTWTLLGTTEWTTWSRIGTATTGALVMNIPRLTGPVPLTLPFQYKDGWFFSGGAEYAWSDLVKLRGGVGYEISPITDDVRTPRLPDNDRVWTSVGISYKMFNNLTMDIGYSHLFIVNTPVNITTSRNPWYIAGITPPYAGTVSSHIDIVTLGLRYHFGG